MHIHEYLVKVARQIDAAAPAQLPPAAEWPAWHKRRQEEYLVALGLDGYFAAARPPLNVKITASHQREGFKILCLSFESLPGLKVAGNLYIPDGAAGAPAVLYLCGHAGLQKGHYQMHARRFAQLGFVTLVIDTVQYGEVHGYHHGTYAHGWHHWISRGYTPTAVEVWNGVRAIDLLLDLEEVDGRRLGVTGNSGGGAITWWLTAADNRVAAAAPTCGTGMITSHIEDRTLDGHCDCMFPMNPWGWSLVDFSALVAPRPCLVSSAANDALFTEASIREFHRKLAVVYDHLGAGDKLELFMYPSSHGYQPETRRNISRFFLKHLMGKDVPVEMIADFDGHKEELSTLAVFRGRVPANDRSTTVQDWLVPKARPREINSTAELAEERRRVLEALRKNTFAFFPQPLPDPDIEMVHESWTDHTKTWFFRYTSEPGWRLPGWLYLPLEEEKRESGSGEGDQGKRRDQRDEGERPAPILLQLPGSKDRHPTMASPVGGVPRGWLRAVIACRGCGETAWGENLQWHLRRAAALTGRTLASLRVLDALQGLAALRRLPLAKGRPIWLAAAGEMAAVALYAALLDGQTAGVILRDPPATQDQPGPSDGSGPMIEMINCLRYTDLPQVAGLLWPQGLVFVGPRPAGYLWAEELYDRLGAPGAWWNVRELSAWTI